MPSNLQSALMATLIVLSAPLSAQPKPILVLKVSQPVAIDGLPDAGYFVLAQDGGIYHYIVASNGLQFKNKIDNSQFGQSFDVTYASAKSANEESAIVTSWSNGVHLGYVTRYASDGKILKSWIVHKVPAGIDFDSTDGVSYFATADSREIYRLPLNGGSAEYFCEISSANRLGSLVIDASRQMIYVADSADGKIFRVDVKSKRVTEIADGFKLPSALRFDVGSKTLYVADSLSHAVYSLKVDQGTNLRAVPAVAAGLQGPSGLALGPTGMILISDFRSGGVLQANLSAANGTPAKPK